MSKFFTSDPLPRLAIDPRDQRKFRLSQFADRLAFNRIKRKIPIRVQVRQPDGSFITKSLIIGDPLLTKEERIAVNKAVVAKGDFNDPKFLSSLGVHIATTLGDLSFMQGLSKTDLKAVDDLLKKSKFTVKLNKPILSASEIKDIQSVFMAGILETADKLGLSSDKPGYIIDGNKKISTIMQEFIDVASGNKNKYVDMGSNTILSREDIDMLENNGDVSLDKNNNVIRVKVKEIADRVIALTNHMQELKGEINEEVGEKDATIAMLKASAPSLDSEDDIKIKKRIDKQEDKERVKAEELDQPLLDTPEMFSVIDDPQVQFGLDDDDDDDDDDEQAIFEAERDDEQAIFEAEREEEEEEDDPFGFGTAPRFL